MYQCLKHKWQSDYIACKHCENLNEENDLINKPQHYHDGGIDVFEYAEQKFSKEENRGFYRMNVIKYISRYHLKNGVEDLEKAKRYIEKLIELEK